MRKQFGPRVRQLAAWCSIFVAAVAFAQSPGSLEWYLKYGREYYQAGDFDKAALYFRQAVSAFPRSAQAQASGCAGRSWRSRTSPATGPSSSTRCARRV